MSSRPAKRARLDTDANAIDLSQIPELVNSIDPYTIARLLITAVKAHPDIASLVQQEVECIGAAAAERTKVVDFRPSLPIPVGHTERHLRSLKGFACIRDGWTGSTQS